MDPITAMAASGMRARMESLDLLANNVANASTGGYKADREFYSLYVAPENSAESDVPNTMPVIERHWTDQSQGALRVTGNPLDLALSGKGFFAVDGPGGPLYTRNGSFHLGANGALVTEEGYPVRSAANAPVTLQSQSAIEISSDGRVQQNGAVIGQLAIVDFTGEAVPVKQGNNYFVASGPGSAPAGTSVEQGRLEASNSGTADAAVRLVSIMRQFEMMQKAVSLGEEMSKQAIEQVAKVGA
jgi:flagellar basal-body rod protein FlgF